MTALPAVVTGLGVVAPNGIGAEQYWRATLAGTSGIGPITRFDARRYKVRIAGEVRDFAASDHLPNRIVPQTDHFSHMGLAAAAMALDDAGVDPAALPEYTMAVVTASSSGGTEFGQHEIERLWSRGPQHVSVYQSIAWFYAATTGQISIRHGMRGPCGVIASEQAGALDAIGQARRLLAGDGTRLAVTGGADASLCPYGLTAQMTTGALSEDDDPGRAYQPFGPHARGYVPGEGGAMLVVEAPAHAAARGARPYGQIVGYAATFDPPPGSGRPSSLRRALCQSLDDAGCVPDDIDVVLADATALPDPDRDEAAAIATVFGPYGVPVTAPKTMTGRLYAGGAALDVACALLAIRDRRIPPTAGSYRPAPGHLLDLVTATPRTLDVRTAMVIARGHGGFNAAMVIRACPDQWKDDT